MDAVLARRETEEGTESNDLLLQQTEAEERQTDGRNAEEPKGRREQAHRPSVLAKGLSSPRSRDPNAEATRGRPSAPFHISGSHTPRYFSESDLPRNDAGRERDLRCTGASRQSLGVPERHAQGRQMRTRSPERRTGGRPTGPLEF